jgi:hypothetical protein
MGKRSLKKYDAAFKARVAVVALQESETLAQVSLRFGVHLVLVGQWRKQLLKKAAAAFILRWSRTGVDAVDPATGYQYEVLSGMVSNMERHGRRMAEEFFRLITF